MTCSQSILLENAIKCDEINYELLFELLLRMNDTLITASNEIDISIVYTLIVLWLGANLRQRHIL